MIKTLNVEFVWAEQVRKHLQTYRELRLAVIPAIYGDKKPEIDWKQWQKQAPPWDQVDKWFNDGKPHNVAIVCGEASRNLAVIDFDDPETYSRFFKVAELENETLVVRTGSGRYHVYLFTPDPVPSFKIPQLKIEIRSIGNIVIAPPSKHPSGGYYAFVNPEIRTIVTVPDLVETVWKGAERLGVKKPVDVYSITQDETCEEPYTGPDPPCIAKILEGVEAGFRNEAGIRIASHYLVFRRESLGAVENLLIEWNSKNKPPLSESEVKAILSSASKMVRGYGCRLNQAWCDREKCLLKRREPIVLDHLNLIEDPNLAGRPVIVQGVVSSTSVSYLVPKEVEARIAENDGHVTTLAKKISERNSVNVKIVGVTEEVKWRRLRWLFNKRSRDEDISIDEKAMRAVYRIRVRPPVFTLEKRDEKIVDERGFEYKCFDIYVTADKPAAFQPSVLIQFEGIALPSPKTQTTTFLAYSATFPEEVQSFDAEKLACLKTKFQSMTVQQRLDWILTNFERYSKIVGRRNLAEGCLLCYFTPIQVRFNGESQKGWGNVLICGDTTTAKSETVRKLISLFKIGTLITAETASVVGLTGTATQLEKEGWFVDWGFLVLQDQKLLAVDGAHKLSTSNWAALAEAERIGIVSIAKAAKNTAYARTRQIKIANAVDREADKYTTRSLASFLYSCQALTTILDKTSIARLDLAVFADQRDVKPEDINKPFQSDYDKELESLGEALKWCWSGRAEVKFTEEATAYLLTEATNLYNTFFTEMIPLASIDLKWKIARLSVGLANLTLSTDDFNTVTVTKEHVAQVVECMKDEYSRAGLNTLAQEDMYETLTLEDVDDIINSIVLKTQDALDKETVVAVFKFIVLQGRVTRDQLMTKFGLTDNSQLRPLMAVLSTEKLVKTGRGLYPTPKLIQAYKLILTYLTTLPSSAKNPPTFTQPDSKEEGKVRGFFPDIGNLVKYVKNRGATPNIEANNQDYICEVCHEPCTTDRFLISDENDAVHAYHPSCRTRMLKEGGE